MSLISRDHLDVYVINLDARTDKLADFDREMQRVGWKYTRYPAKSNGCDLPVTLSAVGEEGCLASHFFLIKEAYERNDGRILWNL